MTEKRQFTVLFSDGSKKEFTSDNVELIYVKGLYYILGLKKNLKVEAIIDEANAKLYADFDWDLSYSLKDMDYLITGPKTYTALDVERMVLGYVRHIGANIEIAMGWLDQQQL